MSLRKRAIGLHSAKLLDKQPRVLSGSASKVFTVNSQFTLVLEWSATQDITNNKSKVTAVLKLKSAAYGNASGWTNRSATLNINGNNASGSINPNMSANSTKEIWRRTVDVGHNSDGTKSFSINASVNYTGITWHGSACGNVTVGGTWSLNTIPRASTLKWTGDTTHKFGTTHTFTISAASSAFRHDLEVRASGNTWYPKKTMAGGNQSFTVDNAWLTKFPTSTKVAATVRLVTKNGTSTIGYKDYGVQFHVPDTAAYKPSISKITLTDEVSGVPAKLGVANNSGIFLQGRSAIRFNVTCAGAHGSTVKTFKFACGSTSLGTNGGYLYDAKLTQYNIGTGSKTLTVTITDSRGRSASKTASVNITPYSNPSITSFTAARTDNTAAVVITRKATISSIKNGTTELNPYKMVVQYKKHTDTTWTTLATDTTTFPDLKATMDITSSYDIKATLSDKLGSTTSTTSVSTAKTLLHMFKDQGVGVGKMWETGNGVLDVSGGISSDTVTIEKNMKVAGVLLRKENLQTLGPTVITPASGFSLYATDPNSTNYPTATRVGDLVTVAGALTNDAKINETGDFDRHFFTLPSWARPRKCIWIMEQGSSEREFTLQFHPDGKVYFRRYRGWDGSKYAMVPVTAAAWLNIQCTYVGVAL